MEQETFDVSLSIRISIKTYQEILDLVGRGKPFKTKVDASRALIQRGLQFEEYLKVARDPEASKKAEQMLVQLKKFNIGAQYVETLSSEELRTIIRLAELEREKRVKQELLNV